MTGRLRKLLFCADRPGWAFDLTARSLAPYLSGVDASFAYMNERGNLDLAGFDMAHVFFWGERWHRRFMTGSAERPALIKEISSHRWEFETQYGPHDPAEAVQRYMWDADILAATSKRLSSAFAGAHPRVRHYPLGVDPGLFHPGSPRRGPIRIGWVGNPKDPMKRFAEIVRPLVRSHGVSIASELSQDRLADFYRSIDVILVTSLAEGTPLPLIEGMASGAFFVATDVGVVRELETEGMQGVVAAPSLPSFRESLDWCLENPDVVRSRGLANAEAIHRTRTWAIAARKFSIILEEALDLKVAGRLRPPYSSSAKEVPMTPHKAISNELVGDYHTHLKRVNPNAETESGFRSAALRYDEDFAEAVPKDTASMVLDIGSGFGHFARWLAGKGYTRVGVIDNNRQLLDSVVRSIGDKLEFYEHSDALTFLRNTERVFDAIYLSDVIEHFTPEDARDVLTAMRDRLTPGGMVVLRTPNMANVMGVYSLAIDLTHHRCYTEQSLSQLLRSAGFETIDVAGRKAKGVGRKIATYLNRRAHQVIFRLQDRSMPICFEKNLVVIGRR